MSKHTPGPWNWTESNILMGAPRSPSDDSAVVLSACYDSEFEPDVSCMPADARLIAAAPDLLAAARLAAAYIRAGEKAAGIDCKELIVLLDAAIEKAEGRTGR